jgi:adenosylhomocysteine nucleosidase
VGNVSQKPVVVVTGTLREASVVSGDGVVVIAGGSDPDRLRRELEVAARGAAGIISFGMCGAIDRSLKLGQWVIGKRLLGGFHTRCDERWVAALQAKLPYARVGAIHADGHLLAEEQDKAERSWASAALAADMESHIAGEVAGLANVPFVILRCVSDIAEMELPPAVEVMMRPDGGVDVGAVMKSIAGQPGQVPHLAATLFGFAKAFRELGAGARQVGSRLGFDAR